MGLCDPASSLRPPGLGGFHLVALVLVLQVTVALTWEAIQQVGLAIF